jgi:hypothetical protein
MLLLDYFNKQLKLVNTFKAPRISQDIIVSGKGIGKECTKYRKKLEHIHWNNRPYGID